MEGTIPEEIGKMTKLWHVGENVVIYNHYARSVMIVLTPLTCLFDSFACPMTVVGLECCLVLADSGSDSIDLALSALV